MPADTEAPLESAELGCTNCGADLAYAPGTTEVECPYCGTTVEIPQAADPNSAHVENDLRVAIAELKNEASAPPKMVHEARCEACGAQVELDPNISADECPFCAAPMIIEDHEETRIQPQALLPFGIGENDAGENYRKWVKKLWFAPNKLKKMANSHRAMKGLYLPFWTYDAQTTTDYTGQRGDNYTETYRDSEGNTRRRTKTRWRFASGTVYVPFDDVLVPASHSFPEKYLAKLEPWDLPFLVPYTEEYLSGFRSEKYQVDLEDGFGKARAHMEKVIHREIERDIGGDKQRVHSKQTRWDGLTFKHVLLPVWISSYRYKDKVYQFAVNARTGEVQGQRPWSVWKIALAVLAAAIVIGGIALAVSGDSNSSGSFSPPSNFRFEP